MRGRVSSLSQLTISASNELGEAESGFLAALVGPVAAVIGGGIGAIAITLIWAKLFPELRLARTFDPPETRAAESTQEPKSIQEIAQCRHRSEERRVGKECVSTYRSWWL